MSTLNDTLVNGRVTQTQAAVNPNDLIRLGEAQTLLLSLFQGAWNNTLNYTAGQLATDGGTLYAASVNNQNKQPSLNSSYWRLAAEGGADGTSDFIYIAYASDSSGTGFSLTPAAGLNYVAFLVSATAIGSPTAGNFTGLWRKYVGADGAPGDAGASSYLYLAWASDTNGTGFSLSPGSGLNYVAIKNTTVAIVSPNASNFTGLWRKYIGTDGNPGAPGDNGASSFLYLAFASDSNGTGFSLTPAPGLNYLAAKPTATAIVSPQASDFTGLWAKYIGADGDPGDPGDKGDKGDSAYVYIAYATDTGGSNFSMTPASNLTYVAILNTTSPITTPIAANFAGLWRNTSYALSVSGPLTLTGSTLGLNAASVATANYVVIRDGSGNFAGNQIAAATLVVGGTSTLSIAGGVLTVNTGLSAPALTVGSLGGVLKASSGVVSGGATTDDLTEGTTNVYFTQARVRSTPLTGISSTNVILATDTILVAFGKIDNLLGGNYASGTVTGNFTINGNLVVTGQTTLATSLTGVLKAASGIVAGGATTTDLGEGTNLYYTDARADARISAQKGQTNGLCPLDSSGKVALSLLYAYGATPYGAASQTAMLALSAAKQGDFALRSDTNITYILSNNSPSILGSWAALVYPVMSVNGATGTITLTTDTVGEGSTNLYFTNARADARIANARGAASGICPLDTNSLVPAANLPPIGNGIWTANSQTVQTNLTSALKGDLANRTDQNLTYILSNNTPTSFGSWVPLLYPVSSVNGATGTITLTTTNITEGTNLYFTTARVLATTLAGFAAGAGTVAGTDTVLGAFQKLQGTVATLVPLAGAVTITGTLTHSATVIFSGTANPGLIVNNLSTTQINALSSSNNGNIVYDTTAQMIKGLINGTWVPLATTGAVPLAGGSGAPMTGALYFQDGLVSNIVLGSTWSIRTSSSNANFDIQNSTTTALTVDSNNHVHAPNGHFDTPNGYYVSGTKVVTTQQAAIADFVASGGWSDSTAYADYGNFVAKFNAMAAMLRVHGLIAT